MSEKSFEQQHDRLMREAFRKLEEDKGILTGSAFRKWHNSPVGFGLIILFFFPLLSVILVAINTETATLHLVPYVFVSAISFTTYHAQLINKRLDIIVKITGAEKKLEEECRAAISQIAGLESKKEDA